jgi:hypothetical protein
VAGPVVIHFVRMIKVSVCVCLKWAKITCFNGECERHTIQIKLPSTSERRAGTERTDNNLDSFESQLLFKRNWEFNYASYHSIARKPVGQGVIMKRCYIVMKRCYIWFMIFLMSVWSSETYVATVWRG